MEAMLEPFPFELRWAAHETIHLLRFRSFLYELSQRFHLCVYQKVDRNNLRRISCP